MYEETAAATAESFDERHAREMRDRARAQARHVATCGRVAALLGAGWQCEEPEKEAPYSPCATLRGPGGARILADVTDYGAHRGRIVLQGCFAPALHGLRRHDHPHHEITVAGDAAPERIAAELRRRLLPEYLAELASCVVARDFAASRHEAELTAARALAEAVPGGELSDENGKSPRRTWFDAGASASFHADDAGGVSVRLTVDAGITPADAAAILRLVLAARGRA